MNIHFNLKKAMAGLVILMMTAMSFAQVGGLNYKALITNNGNALSSQPVTFRFTVLENGTNAVYQETQSAATDANGIVAVNIGEGTVLSGNFSTIDWGNHTYFLKVEIDTGSGYQDFGTSELKYVPYAKYADKAGNVFSGDFNDLTNVPAGLSDGDDVNDADHDPSNELQTISKSGNTITLSNGGGSVTDSDTHLSDADIAAMGYIKDANDADHDPANEIQDLSLNGTQLNITNGTGVNFTNWDTDSTDDVQSINDLSDARTFTTNIFLGNNVGSNATNITALTGLGYNVMPNVTNAQKCVGVGTGALFSLTSGIGNVALGYDALSSNTTGSSNTASGSLALYYNITGNENTASGYQTLYSNTTGDSNTASGYKALYINTTGDFNTASGSFALYSNTTGNSNVAIGMYALFKNTDRSNLVAVGDSALYHNGQGASGTYDAGFNTALGSKALYANTTGHHNTATGYNVLYANTTGSDNTANGYKALVDNTTGSHNTANGFLALRYNTSGDSNTATGYKALYSNTSGDHNSAFGFYAFYNGANYHNSTALGYNAVISASNQVRIGNSSVTSIGGYANWSNVSDARFKTDVQENVPGLDFIKKLRPVTYRLDMDAIVKLTKTPDSLRLREDEKLKAAELQTGFIAQEVEQAAKSLGYDFSGVDKPKNADDYYGLRYAEFVVPLVKAVQEQQDIIERQKQKLNEQEQKLQEQEKRIQRLENLLLKNK